jgi:hypothetical protein
MKKRKTARSYDTFKPKEVYRGISIFESCGELCFYINAYRFTAESIDEAHNTIDRFTHEIDEKED